jgi:hypothetical protein
MKKLHAIKGLLLLAVVLAVLLAASTAFGARAVVVGPTVVHSFYPVGPVYAYRAPVVVAPVPLIRPPIAAAPVPGWYGRPALVRPKVYVWGQPVRNALRAVTP